MLLYKTLAHYAQSKEKVTITIMFQFEQHQDIIWALQTGTQLIKVFSGLVWEFFINLQFHNLCTYFQKLISFLCESLQESSKYGVGSSVGTNGPEVQLGPNVSKTPLQQWGFRQYLPFSWTTLRCKHCRHPIGVMGVVDTFGLGLPNFISSEKRTQPIKCGSL